jgi:hypothetical protein
MADIHIILSGIIQMINEILTLFMQKTILFKFFTANIMKIVKSLVG